jgi:hypothetical protein
MTFYHGGKDGLQVGDQIIPAPPHVEDGCPVCVARARGVSLTVGEYRVWLRQQGPAADRVLAMLRGVPDRAVIDPPRAEQERVYITTDQDYARWHAARSRGDLYEVEPIDMPRVSAEDRIPSFTVHAARIGAVVERRVRLTRQDRRALSRKWDKADRRAERKVSA